MMKATEAVKDGILAALAVTGSVVVNAFGGWDAGLQTVLFFMVLDWVTGLIVAGAFGNSTKSGDGTLDSRAGFKGLCKKGAQLVLILVAVRLDTLLPGTYARTAVMLFLVGNEGISILENVGLMGVPYPAFLKSALSVLRDEGDSERTKSEK